MTLVNQCELQQDDRVLSFGYGADLTGRVGRRFASGAAPDAMVPILTASGAVLKRPRWSIIRVADIPETLPSHAAMPKYGRNVLGEATWLGEVANVLKWRGWQWQQAERRAGAAREERLQRALTPPRPLLGLLPLPPAPTPGLGKTLPPPQQQKSLPLGELERLFAQQVLAGQEMQEQELREMREMFGEKPKGGMTKFHFTPAPELPLPTTPPLPLDTLRPRLHALATAPDYASRALQLTDELGRLQEPARTAARECLTMVRAAVAAGDIPRQIVLESLQDCCS